jgi:hypothetical protein
MDGRRACRFTNDTVITPEMIGAGLGCAILAPLLHRETQRLILCDLLTNVFRAMDASRPKLPL